MMCVEREYGYCRNYYQLAAVGIVMRRKKEERECCGRSGDGMQANLVSGCYRSLY
jgi:hypothetical protein